MDELYEVIEKELNISREVFDRIIADEGACKEICECLFYCLENRPELQDVASAALQYIASCVRMDDDWITVNGTHVLVSEEGVAKSGGKLKGREFKEAKSQKRTPKYSRPTAQDKKLKSLVKRTANLKNEQYRVVDAEGNVLVESKGDKGSVATTVGEKREHLGGNISLHNHPEGGTFSADDLNDFGFGATEMVVASPEGTYTLVNDKVGTREQFDGWLAMRDALTSEVPQEMSFATLQKQAQENLANCPEKQKIDKISAEYVRMHESGASKEELNAFYEQSGYEEYSASYKKKLQQERRRLEVQPQHDWLVENASKYGFTYKFEPFEHKDGGPGSGNFGHEGRPGEIGGSAPGSGGLTTHQSPVGCLFTDADLEVWKKFSDTEAMNLQTGEVMPLDELDEYEPAAVSYEGEDVTRYGRVARSDMNRVKWELVERDIQERGYSDLTDGDVFRMVSAINHYGYGEDCQGMLYSQAPEIYSEIPNFYSKEELASLAKECETVEEFIERAPKVLHSVHRGMTFNDAFDTGIKEKVLSHLKVGEELSFGHISSWSSSIGVADDYATRVLDVGFEEGQNYGVIYSVTRPKTAVSIARINPQGECLTPKKARFKITKVKQVPDDDDIIMYYVDLEEI